MMTDIDPIQYEAILRETFPPSCFTSEGFVFDNTAFHEGLDSILFNIIDAESMLDNPDAFTYMLGDFLDTLRRIEVVAQILSHCCKGFQLVRIKE